MKDFDKAAAKHGANHECDDVMFLFDFALGQVPTLFLEPNKYTA